MDPVKLIIIIAAICVGLFIVYSISRFLRRTARSAEAQVVKELVNLVHEKGLDFEAEPEHPRLISNMTKVYRPAIERDFPSFDWGETKRMIEAEIKERFSDLKSLQITQTEISRYEKSGASRVIMTESAISYSQEGGTRYSVIQTELSYIAYKDENASGEKGLRSLNCPNCSAPLKRSASGEIVCEFCGTIVVGEKDWEITDMKEKA